ncbi:MAG: hypothetical protein Q9221_005428 [Calogaya cf. arnoldii]
MGMNLRNRKIPEAPAPTGQKKNTTTGRKPAGRKPTGVTKSQASTAAANKKTEKPPSARQLAQQAKKAKAAEKKEKAAAKKEAEAQREKDAATKAKGKGKATDRNGSTDSTLTDISEVLARQEKEAEAPRKKDAATKAKGKGKAPERNGSTDSTLTDISVVLARQEAAENANKDKEIIPFYLKPYLKVHTPNPPNPEDGPSTQPAAVEIPAMKKWGGYALPPFGKPFWQQNREDGQLELLLPMLVTPEQKEVMDLRGGGGGIWGRIMDAMERIEKDARKDGAADEGGSGRPDDDQNGGGGEGGGGTAGGREPQDDEEEDGGGEGGDETTRGNDPQEDKEDDGGGEPPADEQPGFDLDLGLSDGEFEDSDEEDQETVDEEDSSSSEQPPWSTDYNFSDPGRRANPPPPDIRSKDYDVKKLGPEFYGLEEESDMEDDAFLRSDPGLPGYEHGWRGIKMLGTGAEGRAGLFQKENSDGKTNSICIKQKNNYRKDHKLRKPTEVTVLEDLRDRPENGSVRLLGYRRYPKIMAHRLYMEFCEHGNLYHLIHRYRRRKQYLPEEFIWDVFLRLVNATKAMNSGPSKRKHAYLTTYVHRDIKPENIFLAAPQGYNDGGQPIRQRNWEQKFSPEELREWGFFTHEPGQFDDFTHYYSTKTWPQLGTPTNIWGVGACMYELIVLNTASLDLTKAAYEDGALGKLQTLRTPEYSKPLTNLVHQCLKNDPDKRPTLERLEKIIDSNRSKFRDRWSAGEPVPEEAVVRLTREEIDMMDIGPFIRKEHDDTYGYDKDTGDVYDLHAEDACDHPLDADTLDAK